VFLLEGIPAIILGFATLLYLTDRPSEASWLTPEEKDWINQELETEKERKKAHANLTVLQALRQRSVIVLALVTFATNVGSQGFYLWLPSTVQKASGFSSQLAAAISGIPFVMGIFSLLFFSWSSDKTGERYWHTALPIILGGCIFPLTALPNLSFGWLLFWLCISSFLFYGYVPSYWVLTTMTLSESAAAGAVGFINCFSALGGFVGPTLIGAMLTAGIPFAGVIFLIGACYVFAGSIVFILKTSN
jgi:ACS family tartrate transporter-like MFS transporter